MHILFIGGTGNISKYCVELLVNQGHTVSCLTRGKQPVPAGARALVAERHDPVGMAKALAGVETEIVVNFLGFQPADLDLDYRLLAGRVRQYIFISSATVYAKPHQVLPIRETHPLGNEFSSYAQAKQACEQWLLARHDPKDFPVTIVRPSHTFGLSWIPNPVQSAGYTFAHRIETRKPVFLWGDGQSKWTLTSSADFAIALAGLAGNQAALGEAVHVTSEEVLSWQQIYNMVAASLGIAKPAIEYLELDTICARVPELISKLKGDKAHDSIFDNSKLRRLVPGFRCSISVAEAIAQNIAWFKAKPGQRCQVDAKLDAVFERVLTVAGPAPGRLSRPC